jgi:hypothetical protein
MKSSDCTRFQEKVNELLVRHRSVLDVLSKYQESNARVNRAVAKTVTNCGCLSIKAQRQPIPEGTELKQLPEFTRTHIDGRVCDSCREVLETELGNNLFYLVALCNILDLDIGTVMAKEFDKVSLLGRFNFS